ncbi:hypothetical protein WJX74_008593 [Apatococcus lobatus]|uniref:FBA domain-containing protein n=1 Tax=Apatococcus lobatus TaxID=904363 RepID=A0AAW1RLC2_9CHLO
MSEGGICLLRSFKGRWALPQLYMVLHDSNLLKAMKKPLNLSAGDWAHSPGSDWQLEHQGGIGMTHSLPVEIHPSHAVLASSYQMCEAKMTVDLRQAFVQAGLGPETAEAVLDTRPALHFSIWGGQRFDCGALGAITLKLGHTAAEAEGAPAQFIPDGVTTLQPAAYWAQDNVASIEFQGEHGKWRKYVCIIEALPAGTRFVRIIIRGRDLQFWRGQYGMKFANPCLTWSPANHSAEHCICSTDCHQTVFAKSRSETFSKIWPAEGA